MGYVDFLVGTPWFWVALAALTLAAAVRSLIRIPLLRGRSPRERSLAAGLFLLSLALVLITLAVFVPGPSRILEAGLVTFGIVVFAVASVALAFPLMVAVPMTLLLSIFFVFFSGYLQFWTPMRDAVDIARLQVVAAHNDRLTVELLDPRLPDWDHPLAPSIVVPGTAIGVDIEILRLHPAYFLLGRADSVRLLSLNGYTFDASDGSFSPAGMHALNAGDEASLRRLEMLIRAGRFPGIRIEERRSRPRRVALLSPYAVHVSPPDELTIESRE